MTEDLDTGVGGSSIRSIVSASRKNTYVIYMADNGAGGGKKPFAVAKAASWEGGTACRSSFAVLVSNRTPWCHVPSWLRLLSDLLRVGWSSQVEAAIPDRRGSIADLLAHEGQGEVQRERPGIVFHFPHYQGEDGPQSAIIMAT